MDCAADYFVYKSLDKKKHEYLDHISNEFIKKLRGSAYLVKYDGTWRRIEGGLYPTIESQNRELLKNKIDPMIAKSARWLGSNGVRQPLACMVYSLYLAASKKGIVSGDMGEIVFLVIYRILSLHYDLMTYRDLIKSGDDDERQHDLRFRLVGSGLIKLKHKR